MGSIPRQIWFWLAALVVMLLALAMFKDILLPFIVGMIIAYALNPLVDHLEASGLNRTAAAAAIVGAVGIAITLAAVLVAPVLVAELQHLAENLPTDLEKSRQAIEAFAKARMGTHFALLQSAIDNLAAEIKSNGAALLASIAAALWNRGAALIGLLSVILITPLVVFYLLVDWHPMLEHIKKWLPRDHAATIEQLASDINGAIAAFIRGQGAVCLCLGVFYALALSAIGLSYGAIVGVSTGALAFVPMIGWVAGATIAVVCAAFEFAPNWPPVIMVVATMLAGMALDTALLSPKLVGRKVGLHPVWLIFALLAFSSTFGIVGTLVAVPVSAAIAVLVRFAVARYLSSSVYQGAAAQSQAEPGA